MELTEGQKIGLETALERYRYGEAYTVISGPAGTGKSSLVRYIIEALGFSDEEVVFTAFTGKAAQVLQRKGNKNCMTLHKLLFKHYIDKYGHFRRIKVDSMPYKLIVVDECSMAPKELVQVLLSFHIYTIFLGDSAQLPPIDPTQDNQLLRSPHVTLTEIMRQAADSEIIQLATKIRNFEPVDYFRGKEVQVIHKRDLSAGMLTWADQILVAKNTTRIAVNNKLRSMYNRGLEPENGDKVICNRNYWDKFSEHEDVLINGTIGYLNNVQPAKIYYPDSYNAGYFMAAKADFKSDNNENYGRLLLDRQILINGNHTLEQEYERKMFRKQRFRDKIPLDFSYAYAITVHRSQGSEWDKILILEENFPQDTIEHARWLYTAVTRAAKKLVLVRKD
jgi:ATP-dependent exoDNAse (exonuclease V) alpha subunit